MKIYNWSLLILLFVEIGCHSRPEKTDVGLLAGYWRIDFITQKNETFHPKGINRLLDYYFIEKNNGIRKKVEPLINNNFIITSFQSILIFFYRNISKACSWKSRDNPKGD